MRFFLPAKSAGVISPARTRQVVARSLAAAANNPELGEFRTGVLQT